ncbi:glycosyltransferase family 4 protein [Jeotgalibacillus proteolyticus]|uniref:glycosyltransferase family 4 protein n=1 Tax=Jeotgalibacillus proteolyticus TaxID=2082395 RepID=UPI003CE8D573
MKVLMIGSKLSVNGGITRVVKNYLKSELPIQVDLKYSSTYLGKSHFSNIVYFLIKLIYLWYHTRLNNYDVYHIHMSYKGSFVRKYILLKILNKSKTKIIIHLHGSQFKEFFNKSSKVKKKKIVKFFDECDVILALGDEWKRYYSSITNTKVISLDNAVFPKNIVKQTKEKIYISSMGLLSKRKGTYDIIEVIDKIKDEIPEGIKVLIGGDGDLEQIRKIIDQKKLSDKILTPGWIGDEKEIADIYEKSLIFLLPSYNEGMPMSILEAMSHGVPVISTNVGSIPSVVQHEVNGYIIEPGDKNKMEEYILELINDKEKREDMSYLNLQKITKKYNLDKNIEDLISIYKQG